MYLMVDNYDSFVYNVVRYFEELDEEVAVFRNDELTIEMIEKMKPLGIIISPGPGVPSEAGISMEIIERFKARIPILGICLGHQVIAEAFGGGVIKGAQPVHGKVFPIDHDQKGLFAGLKSPLNVTRYHSLIVDCDLPDELVITARTADGAVMGLRHKEFMLEGVQFHPEAHLTECGHEILRNFTNMCKRGRHG